jgi:Dolichyl-phosphate-mannose-protein mannosyltransferase
MCAGLEAPAVIRRRFGAVLALVLLGLSIRIPALDRPLLEGAAGKQAHTAMVARNLYRGRSTWLRPMVDDVGRPGYFVKELPLVPVLAALGYGLVGEVREWLGRLVSVLAWLLALPLVHGIVRRYRGSREAWLAGLWFVLSPLGVVYSRAFMTDAALVAISIGALAAALAWRDRPSGGRAAAVGFCVALALLLKPHAIFWLAPALAVIASNRHSVSSAQPLDAAARRRLALLLVLATIPAGVWYLHAAAIHRIYPVPGATVAGGWVAPDLWLRPALYARIADQLATMVFTPIGLVIATIGLVAAGAPLGIGERALLAWGAGVVVQSVVFGTRMFDDAARGTEYYQLAMVPLAALLVARGGGRLADAAAAAGGARAGSAAALAVAAALAAGAIRPILAAGETPARYAHLVEDCGVIRSHTRPDEEVFVLADRGGTVLYYCDRRGTTFTTATPVALAAGGSAMAVARDAAFRAAQSATWLYVPFPEIIPRTPNLTAFLEAGWERVPGLGSIELYRRRRELRRPLRTRADAEAGTPGSPSTESGRAEP